MSSIGASYAAVYVQQKRQKERLLKKMEEGERSTKLGVEKYLEKDGYHRKPDKIAGAADGRIHPAPML